MNAFEYKSEEELLETLINKVDKLDKKLVKKQQAAEAGLLDTADIVQLLKISPRTATRWRADGTLKFIKIKGKIYYRKKDIEELMRGRI